jgi:hypothetical protein
VDHFSDLLRVVLDSCSADRRATLSARDGLYARPLSNVHKASFSRSGRIGLSNRSPAQKARRGMSRTILRRAYSSAAVYAARGGDETSGALWKHASHRCPREKSSGGMPSSTIGSAWSIRQTVHCDQCPQPSYSQRANLVTTQVSCGSLRANQLASDIRLGIESFHICHRTFNCGTTRDSQLESGAVRTSFGRAPGVGNVEPERSRVTLPTLAGYENAWSTLAQPADEAPIMLPPKCHSYAQDTARPPNHPWHTALPNWWPKPQRLASAAPRTSTSDTNMSCGGSLGSACPHRVCAPIEDWNALWLTLKSRKRQSPSA